MFLIDIFADDSYRGHQAPSLLNSRAASTAPSRALLLSQRASGARGSASSSSQGTVVHGLLEDEPFRQHRSPEQGLELGVGPEAYSPSSSSRRGRRSLIVDGAVQIPAQRGRAFEV